MSNFQEGIPVIPGYYWAKWKIPAEGSASGECCPMDQWEIVQVNTNTVNWMDNPLEKEALTVALFGEETSQLRDSFFWGEFVAPLEKP